jgi:hypothetical protein
VASDAADAALAATLVAAEAAVDAAVVAADAAVEAAVLAAVAAADLTVLHVVDINTLGFGGATPVHVPDNKPPILVVEAGLFLSSS